MFSSGKQIWLIYASDLICQNTSPYHCNPKPNPGAGTQTWASKPISVEYQRMCINMIDDHCPPVGRQIFWGGPYFGTLLVGAFIFGPRKHGTRDFWVFHAKLHIAKFVCKDFFLERTFLGDPVLNISALSQTYIFGKLPMGGSLKKQFSLGQTK